MKKGKQRNRGELRAEYRLSDFPGGFVRGKYASRLRKSSNIVVLRPEVAEEKMNWGQPQHETKKHRDVSGGPQLKNDTLKTVWYRGH